MIVVVGNPAWRVTDPAPAGRACAIALAAAAKGARVELVGRAGDDPEGDALLIALTRAGVGHVAVLRDPSRRTPIVAAASSDSEAAVADDIDREGGSLAAAPDAPQLEVADVSLGLAYLTEFSVLVVTEDVPADAVPVVVDAAAFAGAQLVLLTGPGSASPDGVPPGATVLIAPGDDPDDAFAAVVGAYAAALDGGSDPADAFRHAIAGSVTPLLEVTAE